MEAKSNNTENKSAMKTIKTTQNSLFEKTKRNDKFTANGGGRWQGERIITNVRNDKGDITIDITDMKKVDNI